MSTIAVILSGCGVRDGSEIHEAVCTLLAFSKMGVDEIKCYAPNIPQANVINHIENTELEGETRNVLIESARTARGKIADIVELNIDEIDAVVFPGGAGVIKNLCTFQFDGLECQVNEHIKRIITEMHKASKPIGALCIAPLMVAIVLGRMGVKGTVTIGEDKETASHSEAVGFRHIECPASQCVVDDENKLVTTPCYMLAKSVDEVYAGVSRLAQEVIQLI